MTVQTEWRVGDLGKLLNGKPYVFLGSWHDGEVELAVGATCFSESVIDGRPRWVISERTPMLDDGTIVGVEGPIRLSKPEPAETSDYFKFMVGDTGVVSPNGFYRVLSVGYRGMDVEVTTSNRTSNLVFSLDGACGIHRLGTPNRIPSSCPTEKRDEPSDVGCDTVAVGPNEDIAAFQHVKDAFDGDLGLYQGAIAAAGVRLIALVLRKNADYGSSVFRPPLLAPGVTREGALRSRMSDKIQRIFTLAEGNTPETVESLEDSLDDIAGYRILELAMRLLEDPQ